MLAPLIQSSPECLRCDVFPFVCLVDVVFFPCRMFLGARQSKFFTHTPIKKGMNIVDDLLLQLGEARPSVSSFCASSGSVASHHPCLQFCREFPKQVELLPLSRVQTSKLLILDVHRSVREPLLQMNSSSVISTWKSLRRFTKVDAVAMSASNSFKRRDSMATNAACRSRGVEV